MRDPETTYAVDSVDSTNAVFYRSHMQILSVWPQVHRSLQWETCIIWSTDRVSQLAADSGDNCCMSRGDTPTPIHTVCGVHRP